MDETTRSEELRPSADPSPSTFLRGPFSKYIGFALLLSWHYALWFVPNLFLNVELLDNCITVSWIVNLVATSFFLAVIALALGRKRHLSEVRIALPAGCAILCVGTLVLGFFPFHQAPNWICYAISAVMGAGEAGLWILWGERYACTRINFTISHIGTVFGLALLSMVTLTYLLPSPVNLFLVAVLPLLSGAALALARSDNESSYPVLLPKSVTASGTKNMLGVGLVTLFACTACYFLDCIIPWEMLPAKDASFTFGILCGALFILTIAGIYTLSKNHLNIFKIYPALLVLVMVAFALYLASPMLYFAAFIVGIGAQSLFEVLLIMYFGILTSKGYATPAATFAMAGSFVRIGLAAGNSLALCYESVPDIAAAITPETCLVFMCLLAIVLIPLVRLEFSIVALTSMAPTKSEIEEICGEVAAEFALSSREAEILLLIARGHTTKSMADKLVISPYTVNTHIRHIYDKMQIHKRSELLNYLNMQRSDF